MTTSTLSPVHPGEVLLKEFLEPMRNLSTTMGHSWGLIRERFPVWRGMGWED